MTASAIATWKLSRSEWLWLAAVAAIPMLVYGLGIAYGETTLLAHFETTEQAVAWAQKLASSWHAGYLPLWDANTLAGHSFVGEIQTGVFYPVNWLWAACFGSEAGMPRLALEWLIVAHFSLASCGMYVLLRHWQLGRSASALGAVAFALLGPVAIRSAAHSNIFFGLCWLPWVLVCATRHFASGSARSALATGALVGVQVLAGHNQPAFHTALLVAVLGTALRVRELGALRAAFVPLLRSALLMAAGVLLVAGVQLLLSIEYASDAYRWVGSDVPLAPGKRLSYHDYAFRYLFEPGQLASVLDPWRRMADDWNLLYFGSLPLLLAAWLLGSRSARERVPAWGVHGRWLVGIAIFALVMMLGHYMFGAAIMRKIPLAGSIRALGRYAILFHFVGCALFAMAVQAVAAGATLRRPATWLFVLLLLQSIWMIGTADGLLSPPAALQLALAGLAWVVIAWRRAFAPLACALVLVAHVLAFRTIVAQPAAEVPHADARLARSALVEFLLPAYGRYRVYQDASAQLPENFADAHRIQSRNGYGATMYRPFYDFISEGWPLDSVQNDLLNVRWIVASGSLDLPLVLEDPARGLRVYERANWYPRVFLREQLGMKGAVIERALALEVEAYADHYMRFRLRAPRASTAIVSEIDYPGWCARVNGKPVAIARARIPGTNTPLLREVPVEAGVNVLEMHYRPLRSRVFGCD